MRITCLLLILFGSTGALAQEHTHGSAPGPRAARPAWTDKPLLTAAGRPQPGAGTPFAARGIEATELFLLSPDPAQAPMRLTPEQGRWTLRPPKPSVGGYHLVLARTESEGEVRSAATAWSVPGKGPSPEQRFNTAGPGLEVRPLALPEHNPYREGDTRGFLVRFDGVPVGHAQLVLETENGTRSRIVTDAQGVGQVLFPRDFDPADLDPDGGAARTRKGYVVSAVLEKDGVRHVSAFNQMYYPDSLRDRNLGAGLGLMLLGMALATPLLRHKKGTTHV